MTSAPTFDEEPGGDDMLAAEYVLGVLSAEERREVVRRIESDRAFARLVDRWEVLLVPLAEAYTEAEPPASVKAGIDRRLAAPRPRPVAFASGLWRSLGFWRGVAAAAVAALALVVVVSVVREPVAPPPVRLVASLAAEGSDVRYVALYDAAHNRVGLSHLSGDRGPGRDFELWATGGDRPPVSVGVIPVGETVHLTVPEAARTRLRAGAAFAISLEPEGGSPTGRPTGPVVAAGDLHGI